MNANQKIIFNRGETMSKNQKIMLKSFILLPEFDRNHYKNNKKDFHSDSFLSASMMRISITAEDIECVYNALFTDNDELDFDPLTPHEQAQIDAMFD